MIVLKKIIVILVLGISGFACAMLEEKPARHCRTDFYRKGGPEIDKEIEEWVVRNRERDQVQQKAQEKIQLDLIALQVLRKDLIEELDDKKAAKKLAQIRYEYQQKNGNKPFGRGCDRNSKL